MLYTHYDIPTSVLLLKPAICYIFVSAALFNKRNQQSNSYFFIANSKGQYWFNIKRQPNSTVTLKSEKMAKNLSPLFVVFQFWYPAMFLKHFCHFLNTLFRPKKPFGLVWGQQYILLFLYLNYLILCNIWSSFRKKIELDF